MNLHTANNKFLETNNNFVAPDGGGGGGSSDSLLVRVDRVEGSTSYFDHTWQDVYDALEIGKRCVVIFPVSVEADEYNPAVSGIETDEIWAAVIETQNNINNYTVSGSAESNYRKYEADNANSPLKLEQT